MTSQKNHEALDVNEAIKQSEAFFVKYKKRLIAGAAIVLVVVGGVIAYIYGYSKPREDKAQELLGVVTQQFLINQDYEKALKGEGKVAGLLKIIEKYSGTDAGNLARYEAGLCYYHQGKLKEAIAQLQEFDAQNDQTVSAQATAALANCYAGNKQLNEAVDAFKKAAKLTDVPALASEYLLQAGLILESQNKTDEALAIYQQIKKDYPAAPLCSQQPQNGVVLDAMIDKYIERTTK